MSADTVKVMKGTAIIAEDSDTDEVFASVNVWDDRKRNTLFCSDGFSTSNVADAEAELVDLIASAEANAAKLGYTIEWEVRS